MEHTAYFYTLYIWKGIADKRISDINQWISDRNFNVCFLFRILYNQNFDHL